MEVLYFVSLAIFLAYILVIIIRFGIPESISESAYLFGKKGKIIFYIVFTSFILPLLIFWLNVTKDQSYQFLVFLACAGLCFTGITGDWKGDQGKMATNLHIGGTIVAAVCSQIWNWIYIFNSYWWALIVFSIMIGIGLLVPGCYRQLFVDKDKNYSYGQIVKNSNSIIFWVEVGLFLLTYLGIAIYTLL